MIKVLHCPHCRGRLAVNVLIGAPIVTVDTPRVSNEPALSPDARILGMLERSAARGLTVREMQQRTGIKADAIADVLGAFLETFDADGNYDATASVVITVKRGKAIYYVARRLADASDVAAFVGSEANATAQGE